MESNSFRSPSVLSDINVNIQDGVHKKTSPLSVSNSLKNSSSSSENEKDFDDNDQENKPPGGVESTSSADGFVFKKPLPRERMPNEDNNTLNSLIDDLSHLKLGSSPVAEKRFNFFKWTTPLKRNAAKSDESCASSDCSSFDKNSSHSAQHDEGTVENISTELPPIKPHKETSVSHNDEDCSDYYDCTDEEYAISEQAHVSEISSDHCHTNDSSFHSVAEKEHAAELTAANCTFVMNDSEPMNEVSVAEMNRTQDSDQAFILEKYLTEQDFKLEFSLSDASFNAVTGGIDFELGKRQSICSQTRTPVASSLFSFDSQEKSALCLTGHQNLNDVTIQPDQFNDMGLFAKEHEPQSEDALFNLITDCLVQNETRSLFNAEPDENIFALGRMSEAAFLHMNTVEEEDALMQHTARKSFQSQSSDFGLNQNDVNESQIQENQVLTVSTTIESQVPVKIDAGIETVNENEFDEEASLNEITSNMSRFSFSQPTNTDQFSTSLREIDHSDDVKDSSLSVAKMNEPINVEPTHAFEESLTESRQSCSVVKLNETVDLRTITTIDEIFTEMKENSKRLNKTVELSRKTPSPSSLNATIDTESTEDDSFSEKSNEITDSENTKNVIERYIEQSDLPILNQTVDLEVSQNFSLKIEEQSLCYQSFNQTANLEETRIMDDDLVEQTQTNRVFDENSQSSLDSITSNQCSSFIFTEADNENIAGMSLNQEKSNESVNLETVTGRVENFVEPCQETPINRTFDHEPTEVADETVGEKISNQEKFNEYVHLETSPVNVENLAEQCRKSLMDQTVNLENAEMTDEEIDEKSPDLKQPSELVIPQTIPVMVENLPEHCQEFANVFDKNTTPDKELNESVNLKSTLIINDDFPAPNERPLFKLIRSVSFNLDITHIINDETANSQYYAEYDKSSNLGTTQVTNQKTVEHGLESSELNQADIVEVTRATEKRIEDIMESGNLNRTANLEIGEILENDLSTSVEISSEPNQMVNPGITRVVEEKVEEMSDSLNKTVDLEPKLIKKDRSVTYQELSNLNETVDMEITRIFEEKAEDFANLDQQNKTIDLKKPTTIEVNSSALIQTPSHLNKTVDMEFTQIFVENREDYTDSGEQNKTIDLGPPLTIKVNSSALIQTPSHLNETVDMEFTQTVLEGPEDFTDSVQQNKTIDLGTPSTIKVNSSALIQTSSHLNETVDMEFTETVKGDAEDFTYSVPQNKTIDLETPSTIEVNSSALIQTSTHLNETVDMEFTETVKGDAEDFTYSAQQNKTTDLETLTTIENHSPVPIQDPFKLNETVNLEITRFMHEDIISHSPKPSSLENDTDTDVYAGEIEPCNSQKVADMDHPPTETTFNVTPTSSLEIGHNDLTSATISVSDQNDDISTDDMEIEVNEEPNTTSSSLTEEHETLDGSITKSCDNTVIIHESPVQRSNSPARFDIHALAMCEFASPIPPNSPIDLNNKWRTQTDLSSIADYLERYTEYDSPSNSSDEMDVTDTVDSNIAPEMLQMAKLPPGINRSYSNLESIPEMNENELNEEQNASEVDVKQDTKNPEPLEDPNVEHTELKPGAILEQTFTLFEEQGNNDVSSSTMIQTSPAPKPETALDESVIATALTNLNDSIFKTPITKLPSQSDLSALNDSNFNADYCYARPASAKSIQSSRHSLVSPKHSFIKSSPPIYSPFFTPNRKLRQGTPRASGDIPPSLLDMSIGCFEKYTATQAGPSTIPENEMNKTIDVDEEPRLEETKLLCLDEPFKKVNVKTQTHDTELFDLRAENAKLKDDLNNLMEIAQTVADNEVELKKTLQVLAHNELELKKTVRQLEDNNRVLNNRYELLTEYSNELLAKRNAELDEAEEKIRNLQAKLNEYTKKAEASSK